MQMLNVHLEKPNTRLSQEKLVVFFLMTFCLVGIPFLSVCASAQADEAVKFHHQKAGPKVDYQALLEEATPLQESPEGQQLLSNCLEAYGGMDNLENLQSFQLSYPLPGSGESENGAIVKSFHRGRRYKVIQGNKVRILNGEKCWVENKEQTWEMDDFRYRAELYSYLVLGMPYAAEKENFDEVRFSTGEDDNLGLFFFVKTDSLMIIMGVDTADHLIKSTTGVLPAGEKPLVFVNKFDDFRNVEGFIFPHKLINYSLGMKMGEHVLDEIIINPDFPEAEFLPRSRND